MCFRSFGEVICVFAGLVQTVGVYKSRLIIILMIAAVFLAPVTNHACTPRSLLEEISQEQPPDSRAGVSDLESKPPGGDFLPEADQLPEGGFLPEDTSEGSTESPVESEASVEPMPLREPAGVEPQPNEAIFSIKEIDLELSALLDNIASDYNCVAVSLVAFDGKLRDYYTYEYGYANIGAGRQVDSETKFRVASLSKLVVVICALSLIEEGKLDLDADISDYLGYEVRNPGVPDIKITTRMLIQHTSSIYDSSAYDTAGRRNSTETTKRLLNSGACFAEWAPGSEFDYSNFGYSIAGLVCEIVSDKRLDTLARDVLFDPLGIDAAFLPARLDNVSNIAAIYNTRHEQSRSVQSQLNSGDASFSGSDHGQCPGNLTISIIDYARILHMLANGGVVDNVRILSADSIQMIHTADVFGQGYKQGLASRYQNDPVMPCFESFWHTGSAWGTYAQYVYYLDFGAARGVVVVTTGADTGRFENGMVEVCTDLSVRVLDGLGF